MSIRGSDPGAVIFRMVVKVAAILLGYLAFAVLLGLTYETII